MPDQPDNALMTLPDPDQIQHHLEVLDGDARYWLEQADVLLNSEQPDVASARTALMTVADKIRDLTQFGEQANAIIGGLVDAANVALKQRDQAVEERDQAKQDFDEAQEQIDQLQCDFDVAVSEAVSEIFAWDSSVNDAQTEWLADRIAEEGFDAIAEEQREKLNQQLEDAREISYDIYGVPAEEDHGEGGDPEAEEAEEDTPDAA